MMLHSGMSVMTVMSSPASGTTLLGTRVVDVSGS